MPGAVLSWAAAIAVAAAPTATPLSAGALPGGGTYSRPVPYDAYAPPVRAAAPALFEGRLIIRPRVEVANIEVFRDDYADAADATLRVGELPVLELDLVSIGTALVPANGGLVRTGHPRWDYVVGAGRAWRDPGDRGNSRASIPFALAERNANCVHNGVLTWMYGVDGTVSSVAYQVSAETCMYFKADLWGYADAEYRPGRLVAHDVLARAWREGPPAGLPRRPIGDLARRYPGIDLASYLQPGRVLEMTTYGVVADGVLYAGGCPTRAGEYPYCDEIVLPSYSLAKSLFAALALMRLEQLRPGTAAETVAAHVPECRAAGRWSDVTLLDLLDMTSGNYQSAAPMADESSPDLDREFFLATSHSARVGHACGAYPRRSPPGALFVYRSSDTYLLGAAMSDVLRSVRGTQADLVRDLAWPDVWRDIGLPERVAVLRRTEDAVAQPLVGYGLYLEPDDMARIAEYLQAERPPDGLDPTLFREAMQRDPGSRGHPVPGDLALFYQHGFWALRAEGLPGCEQPVHVPFMSGYGGLTLALMPNGVSYFYFSDGGEFSFLSAVRESARIEPYCSHVARDGSPEENPS